MLCSSLAIGLRLRCSIFFPSFPIHRPFLKDYSPPVLERSSSEFSRVLYTHPALTRTGGILFQSATIRVGSASQLLGWGITESLCNSTCIEPLPALGARYYSSNGYFVPTLASADCLISVVTTFYRHHKSSDRHVNERQSFCTRMRTTRKSHWRCVNLMNLLCVPSVLIVCGHFGGVVVRKRESHSTSYAYSSGLNSSKLLDTVVGVNLPPYLSYVVRRPPGCPVQQFALVSDKLGGIWAAAGSVQRATVHNAITLTIYD